MAAVIGITIARILGSLVHLIYGMHILKISPQKLFFQAIARPTTAGLAVYICSVFLVKYFHVYNILQFCIVVMMLTILYGLSTWVISLDRNERGEILTRVAIILNKVQAGEVK
jgi:hypothetical protein